MKFGKTQYQPPMPLTDCTRRHAVMAGLDPAIGYPHQFANDAIPSATIARIRQGQAQP